MCSLLNQLILDRGLSELDIYMYNCYIDNSRAFNYRLVMQQLPQSATLFQGRPGHIMFTHNIQAVEENKFFLAGRLVGMSLTHGGPGLCCLDPQLYQLMCDAPCDLSKFDIHNIVDLEFVGVIEQV